MPVTVKFAGKVREYTRVPEVDLELETVTDVSGLLKLLLAYYPDVERIRKFLFISVNGKLATRDITVSDGDEVMLFFRPGGG